MALRRMLNWWIIISMGSLFFSTLPLNMETPSKTCTAQTDNYPSLQRHFCHAKTTQKTPHRPRTRITLERERERESTLTSKRKNFVTSPCGETHIPTGFILPERSETSTHRCFALPECSETSTHGCFALPERSETIPHRCFALSEHSETFPHRCFTLSEPSETNFQPKTNLNKEYLL